MLLFTYFKNHTKLIEPAFRLAVQSHCSSFVQRREVCQVALRLGTLLRMSLRVDGFLQALLAVPRVRFMFAVTLLPRVRLFSHREIHEGPWSLPGPRRDGNGGSAPVAFPSWWALHHMLSHSFVYSDSQASGTAYCCRVLSNSVEGVRSKRLAPGVTDRPRAKSQDAVAGVFQNDDNRVPLGKRGHRQR